MSKRAYIDREKTSGLTTAIDVRIRPDEIPTVDFEMMFADGSLELCDPDVRIGARPETLQEVARTVRGKLLKKGGLYDSFVTSILSALMPKEHYAGDGKSKIYTEYGARYLVGETLSRIIGLEDR